MNPDNGKQPVSGLAFERVVDADFDRLVAIRIAAMRESLKRVGRFDPERARERLRQTFIPEHTRIICLDGRPIGFYAFRPAKNAYSLDHLYVVPGFQGRGIGAEVLRALFAEADRRALPIQVGALKESASNRFYQRHGFARTSESEWDVYYERMPVPQRSGE